MVHAHPPTATAFAVAGEGIPADVLPEVALLMGEVPVVPYATTGTPALGDAVEPFLEATMRCCWPTTARVAWGADARGGPHPHGKPGARGPDSPGRPQPRPGDRLTPDQMHDLERLRGKSRHGQTDLGY